MAEKVINIRKGLNIRMIGEANKSLMASSFLIEDYAIKPIDFYMLNPKMLVAVGDHVKAGDPLFYDKNDERIKITSPVSGKIEDIVRGEQRRILEVRIKADRELEYEKFPQENPLDLNAKAIIQRLLDSGLWAMVRQRPFNTIANPDQKPKAIVVSGFDTAPLAPDFDFIVHGLGKYFQTGLDALSKLTQGTVHLNLHEQYSHSGVFTNAQNVQINYFKGVHPSGNVGIQMHHLNPVNKGEVFWHVNPQDVLIIGRLFLEGKYDANKIIALAGSMLKATGYHKVISGASIKQLVSGNILDGRQEKPRFISGNILTGRQVSVDGYLGFYDHMLSVIPEGDYFEPFGWVMPGFKAFSLSRSFFSWMFPHKKYDLDTNLHGGLRPFVVTGQFEKVLPMDIYPLHLIKACLIKDIDAMEKLGIYEVDPEDFALCEFVDTSKSDIQNIIREGLELIRKETI